MNDDSAVGTAQQELQDVRLSADLRMARQHVSDLELDVLNSRDYVIGCAAEIEDLKFRFTKQAQSHDLRLQEQSVHESNHRAHIGRLEDALAENTQQNLQLNSSIASLRQEVVALRSSTSWKIGRFLMAPLRLLKR